MGCGIVAVTPDFFPEILECVFNTLQLATQVVEICASQGHCVTGWSWAGVIVLRGQRGSAGGNVLLLARWVVVTQLGMLSLYASPTWPSKVAAHFPLPTGIAGLVFARLALSAEEIVHFGLWRSLWGIWRRA
jgi:hypothetical protein